MSSPSYKEAGVDLELYAESMRRLPNFLKRTHAKQAGRILDLPGGFAGLFRLFGEGKHYNDPVLISGTDGVGTKIKLATTMGRYDTIGIDLVAMCVNDCLCVGAEPLFFLDYIALSKDDPDLIASLVEGVSEGCVRSGAGLLGGETAIMPDLYAPGEFDMAGFCVGVAEREALVTGENIQPGDVLVALSSSGFHSNGFSLVRKVVFELAGLDAADEVPTLEGTVGETLLEPTRIYADEVCETMAEFPGAIHGMAHITGGGLAENIERILPENCPVTIDRSSWEIPSPFRWLQELGGVEESEMFRVFNMGVGYVMVVARDQAAQVAEAPQLAKNGAQAWILGEVSDGPRGVELVS